MNFDGFLGSKDWDTHEEIQSLRNIYANNRQVPSNEETVKTAQPKQMLKLNMRIKNQQQNKASVVQESYDGKNTIKSDGALGLGLEKEVAIMLQEKKYWLSRIQEDNSNMTHLLQVYLRSFFPFNIFH